MPTVKSTRTFVSFKKGYHMVHFDLKLVCMKHALRRQTESETTNNLRYIIKICHILSKCSNAYLYFLGKMFYIFGQMIRIINLYLICCYKTWETYFATFILWGGKVYVTCIMIIYH